MNRDATVWKIMRVDLAGRDKLKSGNAQELTEWPSWWLNNPQCALVFDTESNDAVWSGILSKIDAAAKEHGIELWCAIRDWPMHCTMFDGNTASIKDPGNFDKAKRIVETDDTFKHLGEPLAHIALRGEYLVTNGNDVMLTSADVPVEISAYRKAAEAYLLERGLEPNVKSNVFITLARIKKLPATDTHVAQEAFKRELIRIRREISQNPILLQVESAFTGMNAMGKKQYEL